MTNVGVKPGEIIRYGTDAQNTFNSIVQELKALCNSCVEVKYWGGNSVSFKNGAGDLAEQFGNGLKADMGSIATAIKQATSNISGSLGGQPVTIEVSGEAIAAPPAPADTGDSGTDTDALDGLIATVGNHFTSVSGLLDTHLQSLTTLNATEGWIGKAADNALQAVNTFTTNAKNKVATAQENLVKYIRDQIDSVVAADV